MPQQLTAPSIPMDDTIKTIVQKMIEAGETEDTIMSVIDHHNKLNHPQPTNQQITEPTTFWGGFGKAMQPGGEADTAALEGTGGYLKGAIADLPSSLWSGIKSIGNVALHGYPKDTEILEGIKNFGKNVYDTTMGAGGHPEEFGRMMGNITGQPIAAEGVLSTIPKVPPAINATGRMTGSGLEQTGRVLSRGSRGVTGIPKYWMGRGISKIGEGLEEYFTPTPKPTPASPSIRPTSSQTITSSKPTSPVTPPTDPFAGLKVGQIIKVPAKVITPSRISSLQKSGFEVVETLTNGDVRLRKIK